ncbi:MAG: hypothetical protein CVU40_18325 [Chloroflexi bacterium HGW-Chloroflexi-2]|jgi:hypothetical protein|nr:MAG: hypothetical protein CVU40_18325 [Chloroflexi bacterium HGW-Chloroflexi-2]
MNLWVYLVISLLIITKLMDVLSTIIRIEHPQIETNPLARKMMTKIGIKTTAWIVFGIVVLVVLLMGRIALEGEDFFQIFFLVFGLVLSVIQFAVAHNNWTRRTNFITRLVLMYHRKIYSMFRRS